MLARGTLLWSILVQRVRDGVLFGWHCGCCNWICWTPCPDSHTGSSALSYTLPCQTNIIKKSGHPRNLNLGFIFISNEVNYKVNAKQHNKCIFPQPITASVSNVLQRNTICRMITPSITNRTKKHSHETECTTRGYCERGRVRYQLQLLIFCLCVVYFLKSYYAANYQRPLGAANYEGQLWAASWSG